MTDKILVLSESGREKLEDQRFAEHVTGGRYSNIQFVRLVAMGRKFEKVDFRYSTFDSCYLRACSFDSCDFTGCRFTSTNLHGSSFSGCTFDYSTFERTDVDNDILSTNCPGRENVRSKFARSMRINYQQIGDTESANMAIGVELGATREFLHKSWNSKESYYRKKYVGPLRVRQFARWARFKALDWLWGNGESAYKLARTVLILLLVMALVDVFTRGNPRLVVSYWDSLTLAPQMLFGASTPPEYNGLYMTGVVVARLVLFGLFMSILIKRLNRR